jgi:20S proteasome alpha/beta subunit
VFLGGKMTVLVGVKCKDGIVIGSDSSATFGAGQISTIEQTTKKIEIIDEKIIVAGTGQIGLGQRFCDAINENYVKKDIFNGQNAVQMATTMTQLAIIEFRKTNVHPGQYGALVAYPANEDIHLCEFSTTDLQPELKTSGLWYVSMGGGQLIADPFLGFMRSVFWYDGMPNLQDGIFIAAWTLDHAIQVNPGGVNGPIQIATLTKKSDGSPFARMLSDFELAEHIDNISGAISHLRSYRDILNGKIYTNIPDIPKPSKDAA